MKVSAAQGAGRSPVCSCEPHADGINIFMACAYKKKSVIYDQTKIDRVYFYNCTSLRGYHGSDESKNILKNILSEQNYVFHFSVPKKNGRLLSESFP